ncbi:MAG TPA: acetylornithine transaminase [Bacillota bacterium]
MATDRTGQRVVIKVGGAVAGRAGAAAVQAAVSLRARGWQPVVVHGGGTQISAWLDRAGMAARFHNGRRITDEAALEVVEMVLSARVNKAWVAALEQAGVPAAGLSGRDGGLLVAGQRYEEGVAMGRVGRIQRVRPHLVESLLEAGFCPVISPVSGGDDGGAFNVNADEAAAALAAALGARALLLLTDVPGLLKDLQNPTSVVPELSAAEARRLLDAGLVEGGMRPKLEAALEALDGGVSLVHILDGTDPEAVTAAVRAFWGAAGDRDDAAAAPAGGPGAWPGTRVTPAPTATDATTAATATTTTTATTATTATTVTTATTATAAGCASVAGPAPAAGGAPTAAQWIERGRRVLMGNYGRLPIVLESGEGAVLQDVDGRPWLDFVGGLAVNALGHGSAEVALALADQARRMVHCSNLYWIPAQIELAERLSRVTGLEKWFFCNSGAEANEAAIKLARRWGVQTKGGDAFEIITTHGSFHGRTLGALAATGQPKYHDGFGPMVPGFRYVPYGDVEAMTAAIGPATCAIMVEPIQGEGGVNVPPAGYLEALRRLCDRHGLLLIVDEVQTGMGRAGRWLACQHEDARPDVVTMAKALANGVPIGAVGAGGAAADVLKPGTHASTFGGNPLACAAALAVLDVFERDGLVERAGRLGEAALERLRSAAADLPAGWVVDVRGRGLMLAVEVRDGAAQVAEICRQRGLLVNAIGDTVIRLLPPLNIPERDLERGLDILTAALADTAPAAAGPQ